MRMVNESAVPVEQRRSPKGTYELHRRHMSIALGGIKDQGAWGGGHSFDVELARLLPGKRSYPYHAHAAQAEYYIVVSGTGEVLDEAGQVTRVGAGDHFLFLPGEAHLIFNPSAEDLVYYVIADNHRADVTSYPHTGRRHLKPEMRCVRVEDVAYYQDEE